MGNDEYKRYEELILIRIIRGFPSSTLLLTSKSITNDDEVSFDFYRLRLTTHPEITGKFKNMLIPRSSLSNMKKSLIKKKLIAESSSMYGSYRLTQNGLNYFLTYYSND